MEATFVQIVSLLTIVSAAAATDNGKSCGNSEHEYFDETIQECCGKCPPGTYVESRCVRGDLTRCRSCPPETHSEVWSLEHQCHTCRGRCRAELGLMEHQPCTNTTRRKCACLPGTFCLKGVDPGDSSCTDCSPHTPCPPGSGVSLRGDHSRDTVCETCEDGMFSNESSTTEICIPFTDCSKLSLALERPGNATEDSRCGNSPGYLHLGMRDKDANAGSYSHKGSEHVLILLGIISLLLFIVAFIAAICSSRGKCGKTKIFALKRVFQTCASDMKEQAKSDCDFEEGAYQEDLFPLSLPPLSLPLPALSPPLPKQEEDVLQRCAGGIPPPARTENQGRQIVETGLESKSGIVGPVFIYNPSSVYMGLINAPAFSRGEESRNPGSTSTNTLPFPKQEEGATGVDPGFSQQENGKESHLSEEVSQSISEIS